MDDVLSQQEINTLLNAVKTGQFEEGSEGEELLQEKPVAVKEYDLTRAHRIIRGRMPTYDVMNERLSRLLRSSLLAPRSFTISSGMPSAVMNATRFSRRIASRKVPALPDVKESVTLWP